MISALMNVLAALVLLVVIVVVYILLLVLLFIAAALVLPGFKRLRYQAKQFVAPFPEPGSWAYCIQTWWYDLRMGGRATGNFSIDPDQQNNLSLMDYENDKDIILQLDMSRSNPSGEADSNEDNADESILDEPAYLRRDARNRDVNPDSNDESGITDDGSNNSPDVSRSSD